MSKVQYQDLVDSKIYVKPNSAINFNEPSAYIEPFIDILEKNVHEYSSDNLIIKTGEPIVNQNKEGNRNIAYAKVGLEYHYDEIKLGDEVFYATVGFVYALDTLRPIMKVYAGLNVVACLNLNICNAEQIYEVDLFADSRSVYWKAKKYIEDVTHREKFEQRYNKMITNSLDDSTFHKTLGKVRNNIYRRKGSLGIQMLNNAEKLMFSPTSKYYVGEDGLVKTTEWNMLNAVTQSITDDKEFHLRPNKTLSAYEIFVN